MEAEITWGEKQISSVAGVLGAEPIELRNWLICFGCTLEELRVVLARLADWMTTPPPRAVYQELMDYRLVVLDKRPRVCLVGIGDMLRRYLAKLVMRVSGDQANTACGNL